MILNFLAQSHIDYPLVVLINGQILIWVDNLEKRPIKIEGPNVNCLNLVSVPHMCHWCLKTMIGVISSSFETFCSIVLQNVLAHRMQVYSSHKMLVIQNYCIQNRLSWLPHSKENKIFWIFLFTPNISLILYLVLQT